jgi:hypothetical protein
MPVNRLLSLIYATIDSTAHRYLKLKSSPIIMETINIYSSFYFLARI